MQQNEILVLQIFFSLLLEFWSNIIGNSHNLQSFLCHHNRLHGYFQFAMVLQQFHMAAEFDK